MFSGDCHVEILAIEMGNIRYQSQSIVFKSNQVFIFNLLLFPIAILRISIKYQKLITNHEKNIRKCYYEY